jgi:hypothetical protein
MPGQGSVFTLWLPSPRREAAMSRDSAEIETDQAARADQYWETS